MTWWNMRGLVEEEITSIIKSSLNLSTRNFHVTQSHLQPDFCLVYVFNDDQTVKDNCGFRYPSWIELTDIKKEDLVKERVGGLIHAHV